MFAVVLVVNNRLDVTQAPLEKVVFCAALGTGSIGITAPSDISAGKIFVRFPAAFIDQRLNPAP